MLYSFLCRENTLIALLLEKTWKIATMPSLSQDQWTGQVTVIVEDTSIINYDRDWELVFKVNAWSSLDETTSEDNRRIELFSSIIETRYCLCSWKIISVLSFF